MKKVAKTKTTTTTTTTKAPIAYAKIGQTDKKWIEKTAKKLGVSQTVIIQNAIKQARTNKEFTIR